MHCQELNMCVLHQQAPLLQQTEGDYCTVVVVDIVVPVVVVEIGVNAAHCRSQQQFE